MLNIYKIFENYQQTKNQNFQNQNIFTNFFINNNGKFLSLLCDVLIKLNDLPNAELFAKNFEIKMWEVWNKFLEE